MKAVLKGTIRKALNFINFIFSNEIQIINKVKEKNNTATK